MHKTTRSRVGRLRDLLTRLGCLPRLGHGRIRYRDHDGRRAVLYVLSTPTHVVLYPSRPGAMVLKPLEAGGLRGALRSAALLPDPTVRMDHAELVDDRFWREAA